MNDEQELLKVIWTLKVGRAEKGRKKRIPYREKCFAIQTAGSAIKRARTSETAN
jgi:hypothetical protein